MSPDRLLRVGGQQDQRSPHSRQLIAFGGLPDDRRLNLLEAIGEAGDDGVGTLPVLSQHRFHSQAGSCLAPRMTAQSVGNQPAAAALSAEFTAIIVLIGFAPAGPGQAGCFQPHRQSARSSNRCAGSLR